MVAFYSAKPSSCFCDCFRQVSAADLSREIVEDNIKVTMDDFMSDLNEVKPAFGAAINTP